MSLQLLAAYGISHFFLAVFMLIFTKRRYNWWITSAILSATFLLVFMLEFLRYRLFWMGYRWRFTMVIAIFVGLCGGVAVSKYRDGRAAFTVLLGGSYIMFGDMAAKILFSAGAAAAVVFAVEIVCHLILLFLLIRFLLPPCQRLQQVYRTEWEQFDLMLLMFYGGCYLLYDCLKRPDATIFHQMIPVAYLFTIYLLIILLFQMLSRLNARGIEEREQKILQVGMTALKIEVSELRRAEQRIVEYNHDSRHFIRMLRGMMAERDYQGVEKALSEIQTIPETGSLNRCCRNMPLNGVITYYARVAEEQQIQMRVDLGTLPDDLGENGWEIATVLGCILENAVQAGKVVEPPECRRLRVCGHKDGEQILLEIRNTFQGKVKLDSEEGLGIGMRSLAGFAEQWNGCLDYGVDGSWFYVRILVMLLPGL